MIPTMGGFGRALVAKHLTAVLELVPIASLVHGTGNLKLEMSCQDQNHSDTWFADSQVKKNDSKFQMFRTSHVHSFKPYIYISYIVDISGLTMV